MWYERFKPLRTVPKEAYEVMFKLTEMRQINEILVMLFYAPAMEKPWAQITKLIKKTGTDAGAVGSFFHAASYASDFVERQLVASDMSENFVEPLIARLQRVADFLDEHCRFGHDTALSPRLGAFWDQRLRNSVEDLWDKCPSKYGERFFNFAGDDEILLGAPIVIEYFIKSLKSWRPKETDLELGHGLFPSKVLSIRNRLAQAAPCQMLIRTMSYVMRKTFDKPCHDLVAEIANAVFPNAERPVTADLVQKLTADLPTVIAEIAAENRRIRAELEMPS